MPAPIYTGGTFTRQDLALEEMTAPLGSAVGASAEESWLRSPLSSLMSTAELSRQQYGDQPSYDELMTGQFSTLDAPKPPSRYISAESAREKAKGAGVKLDFQDGEFPEGYVDELIRRKAAESARQDALARAPGGFWAGTAVIGAGIGTSLLDPINVASAFVPVVGEARFASMVGALGLTGARLARGAGEGFVGAAMVEPIVLGAAAAEQADYGMADSVTNLAFGTVVGGGLHVGAGAIGDWLKKGGKSIHTTPPAPGAIPDRLASMSPEERGVVFRTALAQALDGRVVDVDPLIRPSTKVEPGYAPPSTVSRAVTAGLETADAPIRMGVNPIDAPRAERMRQIEAAARQENPQVFTEIERVAAQRDAVAARLDEVKGRAAAEVTPEIAQASTQLREIDARLADLEAQLSADGIDPRKAKKLTRQREEINADREAAQNQLNEATAKAGDTTKIAEADKRIRELDREINDPGTGSRRAQELAAKRDKLIAERDAAIRAVSGEADLAGFDAVRAMAGKDADELAAELKRLDADLARKNKDAERVRRDIEQRMGGFYDIEQLKAIAERQSRPESVRFVDPKMAEEVTANLTEQLKKMGADPVENAKIEAEQAEELLRDLEKRMGLEPEAPVAGAVDPVAEAETITRAVQAMATCGLRR
jgi:hypothetical protein